MSASPAAQGGDLEGASSPPPTPPDDESQVATADRPLGGNEPVGATPSADCEASMQPSDTLPRSGCEDAPTRDAEQPAAAVGPDLPASAQQQAGATTDAAVAPDGGPAHLEEALVPVVPGAEVPAAPPPPTAAPPTPTDSEHGDGTALLFGSSTRGQLGLPGCHAALLPVAVLGGLVAPRVRLLRVAVGRDHALALGDGGGVFSWGAGVSGALALGGGRTNVDRPTEVPVPPATGLGDGAARRRVVVDVAAGAGFSLLLCSDGAVLACGRNDHGQLGCGSRESRHVLQPVALPASVGGLGVGDAGCAQPPAAPPAAEAADADAPPVTGSTGPPEQAAPASGEDTTGEAQAPIVPAATDGVAAACVAPVACDATATPPCSDGVTEAPPPPAVEQQDGVDAITAIYAGGDTAFAVSAGGVAFAWGSSSRGQTGTGTAGGDVLAPAAVGGDVRGRRVASVAVGTEHALLVTQPGGWLHATGAGAAAWGEAAASDGGGGSHSGGSHPPATAATASPHDALEPVRVRGALASREVLCAAAGDGFCLALTPAGEVFAWGDNAAYQLGVPPTPADARATAERGVRPVPDSLVPAAFTPDLSAPVAGLREVGSPIRVAGALAVRRVVGIAAGAQHALAVDDGGGVFVWGRQAAGAHCLGALDGAALAGAAARAARHEGGHTGGHTGTPPAAPAADHHHTATAQPLPAEAAQRLGRLVGATAAGTIRQPTRLRLPFPVRAVVAGRQVSVLLPRGPLPNGDAASWMPLCVAADGGGDGGGATPAGGGGAQPFAGVAAALRPGDATVVVLNRVRGGGGSQWDAAVVRGSAQTVPAGEDDASAAAAAVAGVDGTLEEGAAPADSATPRLAAQPAGTGDVELPLTLPPAAPPPEGAGGSGAAAAAPAPCAQPPLHAACPAPPDANTAAAPAVVVGDTDTATTALDVPLDVSPPQSPLLTSPVGGGATDSECLSPILSPLTPLDDEGGGGLLATPDAGFPSRSVVASPAVPPDSDVSQVAADLGARLAAEVLGASPPPRSERGRPSRFDSGGGGGRGGGGTAAASRRSSVFSAATASSATSGALGEQHLDFADLTLDLAAVSPLPEGVDDAGEEDGAAGLSDDGAVVAAPTTEPVQQPRRDDESFGTYVSDVDVSAASGGSGAGACSGSPVGVGGEVPPTGGGAGAAPSGAPGVPSPPRARATKPVRLASYAHLTPPGDELDGGGGGVDEAGAAPIVGCFSFLFSCARPGPAPVAQRR